MSSSATLRCESCSSLADFTRPELILPELRERDTAGVINELSKVLHQAGLVPDLLAFYHAALNHEFLVNSAGDSEIAFPHARLNGVTRACFSFGRSAQPFSWASRPPRPVRFIFLLAVPATDAAGFLQLLSTLGRLGQQQELLTELATTNRPGRIIELFSQLNVRPA